MSAPSALSNADLPVFFTDAHHALADHLVDAAGDIAAATSADDATERAATVARAMGARHDLYRWLVPGGEPGEGAGVDVRALCLVREMLGYASPLADAIFAVQGLGAHPVWRAGAPATREPLLAAARRGDAVLAFALTEPEAGSDVASLATRAVRDGDGFRLTGQKTLISNAGIATHYVVFANADPEAGRRGIAAFLVDANAEGLAVEPIDVNVDHPIGALELDGCRVAGDALLGDVGDGFSLAMRTLDAFRVTVGAAAVGMARRALDAALAHVRARRQFGKPLAEQQLVQAHLADMATELDAARLLVLRAAHAADGGRRITTEAAMAKLFATEAAQRIVDRAVQLHGGRGVVSGEVVEGLYRAIRPLRIYEGTSEIQRLIIGRALGREPRPR
jgi:acyl-CoA dehydrogenase